MTPSPPPVIAITGPLERAGADWPPAVQDEPVDLFFAAYSQAVAAAGGLPVLIPRAAEVRQLVERVDGLLLTGGLDIHPRNYGGTPHPQMTRHDPHRDTFEMALFRMARTRQIPVLGICRGAQVIAAASEGTLVAHLDGERASTHTALHVSPRAHGHRISTTPGSVAHRIIGASRIVNSLHHQAVDKVGEDFAVTARAEDGTVEAIESADGSVLGVQWHPELEPQASPVFDWLVATASRRTSADHGLEREGSR